MNGMLLNFLVALLVCLCGFKKYVYFLSVGYGLSVAAIGLEMVVRYGIIEGLSLPWYVYVQLGLFMVYGIRLGGFLLVREMKAAGYRKVMADVTKTKSGSGDRLPMPVMICMWILVAALYMVQTSPVYYRIANAQYMMMADKGTVAIVGICVSVLGILIEAISDRQKSAAKEINPHRFCDSGLFKVVRCPNYFGEILFWTGVFVGNVNILVNWYQWTLAVLGYIAIIYIMLNGAKRLEKRQTASYGSDPEYQSYVKRTPIIFPLIPLYSLKDSKVIR